MTRTVIHEDADCQVIEETTAGWPDQPGSSRGVIVEWKPGREPVEVVQARNRQTIEASARSALTANRTYVALASPTNAQNAAQVKALTRQINGVIRLLLNALDGTD